MISDLLISDAERVPDGRVHLRKDGQMTKCRSTADAFQFNPADGFAAAETFLSIEDFQTCQSAFAIVVGGDTFS